MPTAFLSASRTGVLEGVHGVEVVGLRGEGPEALLAGGRARTTHEDVVLLDQGPGKVGRDRDVRLHHVDGVRAKEGWASASASLFNATLFLPSAVEWSGRSREEGMKRPCA